MTRGKIPVACRGGGAPQRRRQRQGFGERRGFLARQGRAEGARRRDGRERVTLPPRFGDRHQIRPHLWHPCADPGPPGALRGCPPLPRDRSGDRVTDVTGSRGSRCAAPVGACLRETPARHPFRTFRLRRGGRTAAPSARLRKVIARQSVPAPLALACPPMLSCPSYFSIMEKCDGGRKRHWRDAADWRAAPQTSVNGQLQAPTGFRSAGLRDFLRILGGHAG